jgi:hypothetical protein
MAAYIEDFIRGLTRPKELADVLQQDITLVQIECYFLQALAAGHDTCRAPAALGGGGGRTTSRQWVRRVNTSKKYPGSGRPESWHAGIERSV